MYFLREIFENRVIIAGIIAWVSAQVVKMIIYCFVNKKFEIERLVGDGGMPSSHSATVTSVALTTGYIEGFNSAIFGIAFIIAIIVMHDASGVRLETGKQARVIKELVSATEISPEERLKEFVGHTNVQVFAGFCLGIVTTIICICKIF